LGINLLIKKRWVAWVACFFAVSAIQQTYRRLTIGSQECDFVAVSVKIKSPLI
jgi:hypothetical protein